MSLHGECRATRTTFPSSNQNSLWCWRPRGFGGEDSVEPEASRLLVSEPGDALSEDRGRFAGRSLFIVSGRSQQE